MLRLEGLLVFAIWEKLVLRFTGIVKVRDKGKVGIRVTDWVSVTGVGFRVTGRVGVGLPRKVSAYSDG